MSPWSLHDHLSPAPEFVALLTSGPEPWHPTSSAVAKARFTLLRSYLLFSISYER